jgi:hypothetical protein
VKKEEQTKLKRERLPWAASGAVSRQMLPGRLLASGDLLRYKQKNMKNTSNPFSSASLMEYLHHMSDWNDLITSIDKIKKAKRVVELSNGIRYIIGGIIGKKRAMEVLRVRVCNYNRKQKISENIRSVFTGKLISPGTSMYSRTLRICRIRRYYSTCREIVERETFLHPISGKRLTSSSWTGKKIIRKCVG